MFYTLDRFEGDLAILLDDNKTVTSVEKSLLGEKAALGAVYLKENDGYFIFCAEETAKRREKAINLHKNLFNKAKKNK